MEGCLVKSRIALGRLQVLPSDSVDDDFVSLVHVQLEVSLRLDLKFLEGFFTLERV